MRAHISKIITKYKKINQKSSLDSYEKKYIVYIESIYHSKEKKDRLFFPYIELNEFSQIVSIWNDRWNDNIEFAVHKHLPERISGKNLKTLARFNWLNDEVI